MTSDDRALIITLATTVGGLAESVDNLTVKVSAMEVSVRRLELASATSDGAAAATRELATQAGAAGARRERVRERVVNTGIAAIAVLVSALGLVLRQQ